VLLHLSDSGSDNHDRDDTRPLCFAHPFLKNIKSIGSPKALPRTLSDLVESEEVVWRFVQRIFPRGLTFEIL